ncbi:diguanylate cyclase [Colwellia asteriadis]
MFTIPNNKCYAQNDEALSALANEIKLDPQSVIDKTESLINDSPKEKSLSLRFLQLQAYVANDLDMRSIPKIAILKQLAIDLKRNDILVETLIFQAMIARRNEHYSDALKYNFQAFKLSEKLHNPEIKTRVLQNLAQLYSELERYKESLEFYDRALLLSNQVNQDISNEILIEKGLVYLVLGNYFQAKALLNQALHTVNKTSTNAYSLKVYLGQLYVILGDYSKALLYLESLTSATLENLPAQTRRNYFEYLARAYLQQGNFTKAITIAKQQLLKNYNTRFLSHQANLQKIVAQAYFQQLDYENAYTFLQRYNLVQQAVHEKVRDSKVLQLEAQFSKEQQESKIKLLEQDSALQKSLYENQKIAQEQKHQKERYHQQLSIIALIVGFIILLFAFRQLQVRKYTKRLEHNVKERTKELAYKNQELKEISVLDQLTGLHNRRFLYQSIDKDISRVDRYYHEMNASLEQAAPENTVNHHIDNNLEHDLTFILIDLDHFKQVNDNYGHSAGDNVLVQMKTLIKQTFRESDFLIRWGGEEFLIVARYVNRYKINAVIERFRKAVATHTFVLNNTKSIHCSCSIGFASYPFSQHHPKLFTWEQVIDIADIALYSAKENQRDAWVGLLAGEQLENVSKLTKVAVKDNAEKYAITRIKNETSAMLNEQKIACVSSINITHAKNLFNQ